MINTPIYHGRAQSDFDLAGFHLLNNPDAGGGGGAMPGTFIDVTKSPYNADKTGVADATNAINQAMADAATAGGGTVFFPKGIYLCNAAPTPGNYNSILNIPYSGGGLTANSSVSLRLLGEVQPAHTVVETFDDSKASTIKTTRTTDTLPAALMAGNSYRGIPPLGGADYTDRNGTFLTIENMAFSLPSNPQLHGLRLDGMGNVRFISVNVITGGGEPLVNSVGIWTPNSENWGENLIDYVLVSGFYTGVRTAEHLFARQILLNVCKVGVEFTGSIYTSYANLQILSCVTGILFSGYHPVDLIVVNEHAPGTAPPWQAAVHDISDASNYGVGVIRHMVGNGGLGSFTQAGMLGGAGLTIWELFANQIKLATGSGAGGSALAAFIGRGAVKPGGTTGQVQVKNTNADYDYSWAGPPVLQQGSYATPTTINQVVACLQAAKLCA